MKLKLLYRMSSLIGFILIICFMTSSLISEFFGNHVLIATVKKYIFYTLPLLIICMIITAISAKKLTLLYPSVSYDRLVIRRVKYIGLNGGLFLAPLATVLKYLTQNYNFNLLFYLLQSLEIICGLINIIFFIKMFKDKKKLE